MARTKSNRQWRCRFDRHRQESIALQQRFLDRQVDDSRRRLVLRTLHCQTLSRAERHAVEYPAGPTVYGEQGFYEWLEARSRCPSRSRQYPWRFAFLADDDDDDDECCQSVRSHEPCHSCRDDTDDFRDPAVWCIECTSRDMCYVQFSDGKVIIAPEPENRWSF